MAKKEPQFECIECGYQSLKYFGRCPQCQAWNSLVEVEAEKKDPAAASRKAIRLSDIDLAENRRIETGLVEFDRLLGGGLVPSSVILIGGEPGVGKSTLLLQISSCLASKDFKILYFSGEESASQIKLRAERLGIGSENLFLITGGTVEDIKSQLDADKPDFLIIDSIQTLRSHKSSFNTGSPGTLRVMTSEIVELAKAREITVFIIGHITKEGQLAGPKTLEHMVDAVLYFQGEVQTDIRILRAEKNRFGALDELGIFRMTDKGLSSVQDASHLFIQHRQTMEPGIAIFPALNGQRTILIEIQTLVTESPFVSNPRRISIGFDSYKMAMLISIIEKKLKMPFYKSDVFLNITGGLAIRDTAADLAICAALVSNYRGLPLSNNSVFIGEVGLTGEVRPVPSLENRIKEAARQGFTNIFLPASQALPKSETGLVYFPLENLVDFYSHLKSKS